LIVRGTFGRNACFAARVSVNLRVAIIFNGVFESSIRSKSGKKFGLGGIGCGDKPTAFCATSNHDRLPTVMPESRCDGGWIGFPPPLWSSNGFWRFSDACREIPPDATGTIENMPGIGNSPTHWTSRESLGEMEIQLEITSSNCLSTLQPLRERIPDAAGKPT